MEQRISQILQIALTKTEEHPVTESKPPKTIEIEEFELALGNGKIVERPEEDLKQALRYIFILIGLKAQNYPVDLEKQMLHAYIFKNYGGHRPEELRLGFEMAIQGKLNLEPKDVSCYENFSIAYFTKIMEAYREWAREQIKHLNKPKPKIPTAREKLDIDLDYAVFLLKQIDKLPVKILK
jgi:hypothetical protein